MNDSTTTEAVRPRDAARSGGLSPAVLQAAMPFVALLVMLGAIFWIQPAVMSYFGLNLLFKLAVPLVFAALAQMLIIMLGDIDLSVGAFVGMITCVSAVYLKDATAFAVLLYAAAIALYVGFGALIHLRRLPSMIVTLGTSFLWLGIAIVILPAPGGEAPEWLVDFMSWRPPLMPLPLWLSMIVAGLGFFVVSRSSFGVIWRAAGGNPRSVERAGWSVLRLRLAAYAGAALLCCLSGLALTGIATSGDPNIAPAYTLLGIGAVILGGGSFTGGQVSPLGTVAGALTLALAGSLLSFMQVPPTWQIGSQGVILFLVLAGRVMLSEKAQ
jgi:ribose transport system permease protein